MRGFKQHQLLLSNFFFLSISSGINLVIPLLVIPFLITKIGISRVGEIAILQSLSNYFISLVDYGFSVTGTKAVAQQDKNESKLFSEIFLVKLILICIGLAIFSLVRNLSPFVRISPESYFLSYLLVIGQGLIPNWFFLGKQDNKAIAVFNLISKAIYVLLLYKFVTSPRDSYLVNMFFGISNILVAVISYLYISIKWNVFFKLGNLNLLYWFKNNFIIYLSSLSFTFITNSNTIILSYFTTTKMVGYYSIVEKILFTYRSLYNLINQATLAYLCKLPAKIRRDFIYKTLFVHISIGISLYILATILNEYVIVYFYKENNDYLSVLLRFSYVLFIIVSIGIVYYQALVASNNEGISSKIISSSVIVYMVVALLLIPYFKSYGAIYSLIITEAYIVLVHFYFVEFKIPEISILRSTKNEM